MSNSKKGDRVERSLVKWLYRHGWAVIRAPASGGATQRELPDVLAGNGERVLAVEVKSSRSDAVYLSSDEVEALERFALSFGALPVVAVRFTVKPGDPAYGESRPGFYFLPTDMLYETDSGNYRIKKATAHKRGIKEVDI